MKCKSPDTINCREEKMGCNNCYYNEPTADEMFEELEYSKVGDEFHFYYYSNDYVEVIEFNLKDKTFIKYYDDDNVKNSIDMQELQAINKKVKELRMDRELKEFLIKKYEDLTENVKVYERKRRCEGLSDFYMNSFQNQIHKDNACRELIKEIFQFYGEEYQWKKN